MKRLPFLLFALLTPMLLALAQWQPTILWEREGATANAHYGSRVFALGDQNDDGYADFGVSGSGNAGRVELFYGGNPPAQTPYLSFQGNSSLYAFHLGNTFGDITGDGYLDWYVWTEAPQTIFRYELFFGGPTADSIPDLMLTVLRNPPAHEVYLDPIGDFNGDGFDDLYRYDFMTDSGQVYFGGDPLDTLVDWTCHRTATQQALPWSYGDLNGDGYSDFVSETIGSGWNWLWVFHGGAVPATDAAYRIDGGTLGDYLDCLAIVNDLNGDGRDEFVAMGGDALAIGWGAAQVHDNPDLFLGDPCAGGVTKTFLALVISTTMAMAIS